MSGGERKAWLDAGKGISMLLVLLFHSEMYLPTGLECSPLFTLFRMPFFFFLSGYLFTSDYLHFSLRKKLKQILRGIVWTYLLFASVILFPKSILNEDTLGDAAIGLLLGHASWFVVALGGSQVMFAFLMRYTKRKLAYALFMLLSLCAAYAVKAVYPYSLPYCLDCTLVVNFFFGLGIFYRWHEADVHRYVAINKRNAAAAVILFFALTRLDDLFIHSNHQLFNTEAFVHFPLSIAYACIGVAMMTLVVRAIHFPQFVQTVGKNSLVFYYLNGGTTRGITVVLGAAGITEYIDRVPSPLSYLFNLLLAAFVAVVITYVALAIRKYFPLAIGDKQAFNRLSKRWGLGVEF